MKKLLATIVIVIATSGLLAQQNHTKGTVIYDEIIKMDIHIDNLTPEMASMLPKESKNEKILYFNEKSSRYENYESNSDDEVMDDQEGGVRIMISQPDNIIYRDIENNTVTEQTEFMTRVFLIESEREKDEWKITGNQKMILNLPCMEAKKGEGEEEVVAWFTPAVPVSAGPSKLGDLPGMIMEMIADSGNMQIIARSINFDLDEEKLVKPKKGKKVSREKFEEIVAEKTKEMGVEGDVKGSKTVIMTISQ